MVINLSDLLSKVQGLPANRTTQLVLTPIVDAVLVVTVLAGGHPDFVLFIEIYKTYSAHILLGVLRGFLANTSEAINMKILTALAINRRRHEYFDNSEIVSTNAVRPLRVVSINLNSEILDRERIFRVITSIFLANVVDEDCKDDDEYR